MVALAAGVLVLLAITAFAGWQGIGLVTDGNRDRAQARIDSDRRDAGQQRARADTQDRTSAMAVAAAFAVKLTSVGWRTVDADVSAILAGSTGAFHDDFAKRSQSFADVVRSGRSESTATVGQTAVEKIGSGDADVLVAVTVETRRDGAAQEPRSWRMRIGLERGGADYLASKVEFVP